MFKTTATTHIRERDGERFVKMREVGFRRQSLPAARIVSELAANSLYPDANTNTKIQIHKYNLCDKYKNTQQIQWLAAARVILLRPTCWHFSYQMGAGQPD